MKRKFECPGKELPNLIFALNQIFYPRKQMTREEHESLYRIKYPMAPKKIIDGLYRDYEKAYARKVQSANSIISSKRPHQLLKDLRTHVDSCSVCKPEYFFGILKKCAEWEIHFGKQRYLIEDMLKTGQAELESCLLGLIYKEESELLGLLKNP